MVEILLQKFQAKFYWQNIQSEFFVTNSASYGSSISDQVNFVYRSRQLVEDCAVPYSRFLALLRLCLHSPLKSETYLLPLNLLRYGRFSITK